MVKKKQYFEQKINLGLYFGIIFGNKLLKSNKMKKIYSLTAIAGLYL